MKSKPFDSKGKIFSKPFPETEGKKMKIACEMDEDAARILAFVIRRVDRADIQKWLQPEAYGVDVSGWQRAVDALSPELPEGPFQPLDWKSKG